MLTRPLGPGAPKVSAIGFGAMPLSIAGRPSEAVSIDVIHRVLDAGVTLIDTADVYCLQNSEIGHNERLVAKALRSWPGAREGVIVATKGGLTRAERPGGRLGHGARPDQLRAACERSLRALQVERIDLYQLHQPDSQVPFADSVGELAKLQRAGKIRWIGLSNVTVDQLATAQAIAPVVTVQNRLNPLARGPLARGGGGGGGGVVQYCAERGIGFLAYGPLGGRSHGGMVASHPVLRRIARRLGASPQAVALAWLLAQAPCVIPIPGARTVAHALDSAGAAALTLDAADIAAIDRATFALARFYDRIRSSLRRMPGLWTAYQWVRGRWG